MRIQKEFFLANWQFVFGVAGTNSCSFRWVTFLPRIYLRSLFYLSKTKLGRERHLFQFLTCQVIWRWQRTIQIHNSFGSRCHKSTFFFLLTVAKFTRFFFCRKLRIVDYHLCPQNWKKEQKTKENKSSHRTCAQGETEFTCFVPKYDRFGSTPPLWSHCSDTKGTLTSDTS